MGTRLVRAVCEVPWALARASGVPSAVPLGATEVWLRAFYLAGAALAASGLGQVRWLLSHPELDALWPVAWAPLLPWPVVVWTVSLGFLATMGLAGLAPWRRSARIGALLGVLFFGALVNSYGKVNHGYHILTLVSLILTFLPNVEDEGAAERCRDVLFAALVVVLSTYTYSGISKVLGAMIQLWREQPHAFQPDALARIVASRTASSDPRPVLAALIVRNPGLGAPLHLAAIYLELVSLVVAFRPPLWRAWGTALLGLHAGILLVMGISFIQHAHLVALCLVATPLCAPRQSIRSSLFALPYFGPLLQVATQPRSPGSTLTLPAGLGWLPRLFGVPRAGADAIVVVEEGAEHPRLTTRAGEESVGVLAIATASPRARALALLLLVPGIVWDTLAAITLRLSRAPVSATR